MKIIERISTMEDRLPARVFISCGQRKGTDEVQNTLNSEIIFPETVEVKWTGYDFPMANIAPDSHRSFDALFMRFDEPNTARPLVLTNYSGYSPPLSGPGEYILKFLVLAENFPPARILLKLRLGTNLDDAHLQVAA